MSAESTFRCPVCRASQTLREECRRCQADLSLVVRARRRLSHLIMRRGEARSAGDDERSRQIDAELRWLAPSNMRAHCED
jgi:hypothetical protein